MEHHANLMAVISIDKEGRPFCHITERFVQFLDIEIIFSDVKNIYSSSVRIDTFKFIHGHLN